MRGSASPRSPMSSTAAMMLPNDATPTVIPTSRARFTTPEASPLRRIGMADIADAQDAPASLFATAETRALKTETAIDALRDKFGAGAVVAGRALKRSGERPG